ncbi:SDR family NAD(P)-dependent oxidoreductase [Zobellia nedashkovskayae]
MKHAFDMTGKVALITGGGTGIGKGIAEEFIKLGAIVVITGRQLAPLQEAKANLGDNCHLIVNDVTKKEEHPSLIKQIEEEIGPLEILVNNAGKHSKSFALETTDADFQSVIDTNLNSVFALTRAALKYMVPRKKRVYRQY